MRWPWLCALFLGSEDPGRVNPDRPNLTNSLRRRGPRHRIFGRDFLDRRLQLWVESYARIALVQGELSEVAGDLGLIVTVHRRLALDVAGLVGQVGGDTLVAAVLAGISVRIGPP